MATIPAETITVQTEGLTLNIILWRKFKRPYQGIMEATLEANLGLADLCPVLPVGTVFTIPATNFEALTSDQLINLWD